MRMRASPYAIVPVGYAIETVLANTPIMPTVEVTLTEAIGRVLAENVVAQSDMPPFATTAVDGYAIIAGDGMIDRTVLGEIIAGQAETPTILTQTAARIMTGAPLPPGADAVIMVEDTTENAGRVQIQRPAKLGDNVYQSGQDVRRGQTILTAGTMVGAAEIGLLATVGHTTIRVYRPPVVAVLSTGDELVEPHEPLHGGAIRDSNRYALLASIAEAGGVPLSLGKVRDDEIEQEARIREGLERADVLLTSGGVSVGSRDLIKPIFERLGQIHFGRIAFKPGKPTTFATIGAKLAFGLPGFPVSSLVSFEVFVRPALRKMQGHLQIFRPQVQVIVEHDLQPSPDRTEYQRAVVRWEKGRLIARATGAQRSSRLLSLVGANALLRIDPGDNAVSAGTEVPAMLIGELNTPGR